MVMSICWSYFLDRSVMANSKEQTWLSIPDKTDSNESRPSSDDNDVEVTSRLNEDDTTAENYSGSDRFSDGSSESDESAADHVDNTGVSSMNSLMIPVKFCVHLEFCNLSVQLEQA